MNLFISKVTFNFHQTGNIFTGVSFGVNSYKVGEQEKNGNRTVKSIKETLPSNEGEKYYVDVTFTNNEVIRIFNLKTIEYLTPPE